MLSRRVSAYYGLMCPLGSSLRLIFFVSKSLFPANHDRDRSREVPQFTLRICSLVPPSVPRWTTWLLSADSSPCALAFAFLVQARHPRHHHRRFSGGTCNEA